MKTYSRIYSKNYIIPFLSFLLVWLLFSGNFYNEDYDNYVYAFNLGLERWENLNIEPIFAFITSWAQDLGIADYLEFKSWIAFIFMLPYWYILTAKSDRPALSIFIYIPLFLVNVVILRNFMAFAVMSISFLFLYKGGKKNLIFFFMFFLFAEGIHNLMFIYLIFLCKDYIKFDRPIVYFGIACLAAYALMPFVSETISNLDTTKYSIGVGKEYRVILGIPLLVNYLLLRFLYNNSKESGCDDIKSLEKFILEINFIIMAIVCFYTINFNTQRLANNLFVFNSVFIANRLLRRNKKNTLILPVFIIYILFLWWYMCYMSLGLQFDQIFQYNYFIQYLF